MRPPTTRLARRLTTLTAGIVALVPLTAAAAQAVTIDGIDTSHYQHSSDQSPSLDWADARADGVRFAFSKATEGTTFKDPYFDSDWVQTKENGIFRGAYHFARPSKGSARDQARFFAGVIGPQKGRGTLPPVLDLEATGGLGKADLVQWTRNFLDELETLTGRTPIIYVSPYFWESWLGDTDEFHHYQLWIAHYGTTSPRVPGDWPSWTFWQTSSSGRIKGISGRVDTDLFNGDIIGLKKLALAYEPQVTTLTLTPSNAAPRINKRLTLTGRLTDPNGSGLQGRTIILTKGSTSLGTVRTKADGSFKLKTLVTGAASYQAAFAGDSDFRGTASPELSTTLTPTTTRLTVTASASSVLAGQSVRFTGQLKPVKPLAGRTVKISVLPTGSKHWKPVGTTETDADGSYDATFPLLDSGTYSVAYVGDDAYATSAARQPIHVALNPTEISMAVSNAAPYAGRKVRLTGTLRNAQTPVARRTVVISRIVEGGKAWHQVASVRTDADGTFSAQVVADRAASYHAVFLRDTRYSTAGSTSRAVTITPPGPTKLDLRLHRTQVKHGRGVVVSGTLLELDGSAVAHRKLQLWSHCAGSEEWRRTKRIMTSSTGAWRTVVTPPRTCSFRAEFEGGPEYAADSSSRSRLTVV